LNEARIRATLRPHGRIAADCKKCLHYDDCGGIEPVLNLFNTDCVQANCCHPMGLGTDAVPPDCDNVCPNNPKYLELLREVGGLSFDSLRVIEQSTINLPRYIPMVYRRYALRVAVKWPMVALGTYEVALLKNGHMETVAKCPEKLRQTFGLSPETEVILRGVADDRPLERYWSHRRRDRIPQQLATLGMKLAVGPNFSHFLDVPRHDNLFNRKRQLICIAEFADAGQPGDWRFWERFLAANPSVSVVAIEFETGNRSRVEGEEVIRQIAGIQDAIGRQIHPLVVGGTQYLEWFATHFEQASFIDSTPFMKTVKRQAFNPQATKRKLRWEKRSTALGEPLDELLAWNLKGHSDSLDRRWASIKGTAAKRPARRSPLQLAAG
jgi:Domain of unknown function (DUF4417)